MPDLARSSPAMAVACLLAFAGCASAPTADDSIRVMSFNVRYGAARDGANHWSQRKDLVTRTIRGHDPDLLGLQEALPFQARHVQAALPDHDSYGPSRQGPEGEACTLFWRRDRFEVLAKDTFWLSPTPADEASRGWDAALPRICSTVHLRDRHNGRQFLFANTHFDHRGRTARAQSAQLLAGRLGETVVLTGDLNAGERSPPLERLRAAGFRDSYRIVHPKATRVGTFNGFGPERGKRKIDYVLVRGRVDVLDAAIDPSRFDGRWPSDHLPVTARVRIAR